MGQLSLTLAPQAFEDAPCAALLAAGRTRAPERKTPERGPCGAWLAGKKRANAIKEDNREAWQKGQLKDAAAQSKIKHPIRRPKPPGTITIKVTA